MGVFRPAKPRSICGAWEVEKNGPVKETTTMSAAARRMTAFSRCCASFNHSRLQLPHSISTPLKLPLAKPSCKALPRPNARVES